MAVIIRIIFAISFLHLAVAHLSWITFMNNAKALQKDAASRAESILQYNADYVGAVVPIVEVTRGKQDLSKYYKFTMHMKSTGYNYAVYAPESLVIPWSIWRRRHTKQLCPQSDYSYPNLHCEHALFLVDETKYLRLSQGKIIYRLENVKEVNLIGHDIHENIFFNIHLLGMSSIQGGSLANHYDIRYVDAATLFYLNCASKREIIDLSQSINAQVSLKFYVENNVILGELGFDSVLPARLIGANNFDAQIGEPTRQWMIVGRENKPDNIECTNAKMIGLIQGKIVISANGFGGTESQNDVITNCVSSVLKLYTTYNFTYPGQHYRLDANLNDTSSAMGSFRKHSTIHLHGNRVTIVFDRQDYLERVVSMKYSPWRNELTLEILWPGETVMVLGVKGIVSDLESQPSELLLMRADAPEMLSPLVRKPAEFNEDTILDTTKFLLFRETAGVDLNDALKIYQEARARYGSKWLYIGIIRLTSKRATVCFGSPDGDSFNLKDRVIIKAENGPDSLNLMKTIGDYVWIDNDADDGLYDTLTIDSGVCNDLKIEKHLADDQTVPRSESDLVLKCEKNPPASPGKVVLMNYLKDKSHRHLKIMWNNFEYIILPGILKSSGNYTLKDCDTFSLGRVIDWKSSDAVNHSIVEPANLWILLSKEKIGEIEAREENSNVVLFVKSMNLSIELKNFLKDGEILEEWRDKFFAVADDLSDESTKIQFVNLTLIN